MSQKKITPRQCKIARGLIHWNIYDLSNNCGIQAKRLDSFEKSLLHLVPYEFFEIVRAFKMEGVEFTDDFEVKLTGQRVPKKLKPTVPLEDPGPVVIDENHEVFEDLMGTGENDAEEEENNRKKIRELMRKKEKDDDSSEEDAN